MTDEEFAQLPQHENYAIRLCPPFDIYNITTGRCIAVSKTGGRPHIKIGNDRIFMDELLAYFFVSNFSPGDTIVLKDGNKANFYPENLAILENFEDKITWEEVQDFKIDITDHSFSVHDLQDGCPYQIVTRGDLLNLIQGIRMYFLAINSTPMVYLFKDFVKGVPVIATGKISDCRSKLSNIKLAPNHPLYPSALELYQAHNELFTYDDVCFCHDNPRSFTFFQGYDIPPAETYNEDTVDFFMNFVHDIIANGNRSVFDYIMGWLAKILQQPGTKVMSALVLIGEPRTGKNTFAEIICNLFGRCAVPNVTDIKHIIGKFNSVFENKRLVVCNEL